MYATLLFDEVNSEVLDNDFSEEIVETNVDYTINGSSEESITLQEILTNLAKSTFYDQVSIFNTSQNHIWVIQSRKEAFCEIYGRRWPVVRRSRPRRPRKRVFHPNNRMAA